MKYLNTAPVEFTLHHTKHDDWSHATPFISTYPTSARVIAKTTISVDEDALTLFNTQLTTLLSSIGSDVSEGSLDFHSYSEYIPAVITEKQKLSLIDVVDTWLYDNKLLPTICIISDIRDLTATEAHRGSIPPPMPDTKVEYERQYGTPPRAPRPPKRSYR